jgi:hypothetical protein
MTTDYIVRLKCPYGDQEQVLVLENREETLKQILETPWDFECSIHGVQREMPLEGKSKNSLRGSPKGQRTKAKEPGRVVPRLRSSKRIFLNVPVFVSGCIMGENSFHEDATALLVNAGGGLLSLSTGVALGDTIFVTNKQTQREQECRVAYLGLDTRGKSQVGIAFKRPAPHFWRLSRREYRISKRIRITVRGIDRNGHPFVQSVCAVDISRHGARVEDIGPLTSPGETIQLKRHWQTALFRVAWIGDIGTPQAGQAGIIALEPKKNIWGVTLP